MPRIARACYPICSTVELGTATALKTQQPEPPTSCDLQPADLVPFFTCFLSGYLDYDSDDYRGCRPEEYVRRYAYMLLAAFYSCSVAPLQAIADQVRFSFGHRYPCTAVLRSSDDEEAGAEGELDQLSCAVLDIVVSSVATAHNTVSSPNVCGRRSLSPCADCCNVLSALNRISVPIACRAIRAHRGRGRKPRVRRR